MSVVAEAPQAGADSVLGPAGEGDDDDGDAGEDAAADAEDASDSEDDADAAMEDGNEDATAQVLLACQRLIDCDKCASMDIAGLDPVTWGDCVVIAAVAGFAAAGKLQTLCTLRRSSSSCSALLRNFSDCLRAPFAFWGSDPQR